jgi:hypothetical protein
MKIFASLFMLALVAGCVSNRAQDESFQSLHRLVEQKLAGTCDCEPITNNAEVFGRFFDVVPIHSAYQIRVFEFPFYSETEWKKRFDHGADQFHQGLSTTNLALMPSWSFESTGIELDMQPHITPSGVDKDWEQADHIFHQIVSFLKQY